jgi:uncharacterized membrane protein YbhN (UPF0104 family)
MKKILKYIHLIFISVFLLFILIFIKNNFNNIKEIIISISFLDFFILSISTWITILLNGNKIEILTKYYGLKLKFKEWFGLSVVTTMSNYLAPFGLGMSLRGIYLKRKYNFSYGIFITTLATSYLTSFFLYSFLGLIVIIIFYFKYNFSNIFFILNYIFILYNCDTIFQKN